MLLILLPFAVALLVGATLFAWRLLRQAKRDYHKDAQNRWPGPPVCRRCGYSLFYANEQRCPECGLPFELDSIDGRLAEWDGTTLRPKSTQRDQDV